MPDSTMAPGGGKNAERAPDPIFDPYLACIDAALERDSSDPATVVAEVEAALDGLNQALGPKRKAKRQEKAAAALEAARSAMRARKPDALRTMREALEVTRKAHGLPPKKTPRRREGLASLLQYIPPPKSVCRALEWDVGRVPMLIGPPGAGKTFVIQQAELDMSMGRPLWGCEDFVVPGPLKVLHVDLDQGAAKTKRRAQRLLVGAGVKLTTETDVAEQLARIGGVDVRSLGRIDIDTGEGLELGLLQLDELARWRSVLVAAFRGYDLVVIDSLRRLAPLLDENDSRFSEVMKALLVVSEEANAVILVLHHATNKAPGGPARPGASAPKAPPTSRGSSGIDAGAGTQLAIQKDKGLRKVTQIRAGDTAEAAPFFLAFENDEGPGPLGVRGVRLVWRSNEEAKAPEKDAKASKLRKTAAELLKYIREKNLRKGYGPTRREVVEACEGRDATKYAALELLASEKQIRTEKAARLERIWAADVSTTGTTAPVPSNDA